jgi:hypothetical protein
MPIYSATCIVHFDLLDLLIVSLITLGEMCSLLSFSLFTFLQPPVSWDQIFSLVIYSQTPEIYIVPLRVRNLDIKHRIHACHHLVIMFLTS